MESNKYICPDCGAEMLQEYEKPALNLSCPKCGCKIATTKWEEIDLDDTVYSICIEPFENPTMEQIKVISKSTGMNFAASKTFLKSGGILFRGSATEILEKKKTLEANSCLFHIAPTFKY
ncbi:MAG: hypothetical protein MJ239_00925 [Bacilli bacterium]|nr:hypothetical protein [Bacilli bacterium]